jgi:hypothetical protein
LKSPRNLLRLLLVGPVHEPATALDTAASVSVRNKELWLPIYNLNVTYTFPTLQHRVSTAAISQTSKLMALATPADIT